MEIRTQEGEHDPTHFLLFCALEILTHNQGHVQDEEDWKGLIHEVVKTTSRGELQQASETVDLWMYNLSICVAEVSTDEMNTTQSIQFDKEKTAYNAAASVFHAVFGEAQPRSFQQWMINLRALCIITPHLQTEGTKSG